MLSAMIEDTVSTQIDIRVEDDAIVKERCCEKEPEAAKAQRFCKGQTVDIMLRQN